MTKQEHYQTLLDSLDFFETKIQILEATFDAWFAMVRLYEMEAPVDPDLLKQGMEPAYNDLNLYYTKQLNTIELLIVFHESEKYNSEVELKLADDFLIPFKDATYDLMNARKRAKDSSWEILNKK